MIKDKFYRGKLAEKKTIKHSDIFLLDFIIKPDIINKQKKLVMGF